MKNRILGLMAAAAAMGLAAPGGGAIHTQRGMNPPGQSTNPAGMTLAELLQRYNANSVGFGGGGYERPSYPNGPGWSNASVKRMKRKRRNRLRAKGQHRQAVR